MFCAESLLFLDVVLKWKLFTYICTDSPQAQLLGVILKFYFIEVYLTYNVVLISTVQQRDSVVYIHTYIYTYFFIFFPIMIYHRILNMVPFVIQ